MEEKPSEEKTVEEKPLEEKSSEEKTVDESPDESQSDASSDEEDFQTAVANSTSIEHLKTLKDGLPVQVR